MASLHLEVLPPPQRRLWTEFGTLPSQFVLYGGTAIALQLGHRQSIDFDFFSSASIDTDLLFSSAPWLQNAEILRRSPDTLTLLANRDGPVKLSFFATPHLRQLREPGNVDGVRIASLLDLAGTKASVVQQRAEAKDYFDIDALLRSGLSLSMVLAAARAIFGFRFDPQSTLKALSYFGDGDLDTLDGAVQANLRRAVREVDLHRLPDLGAASPGIGQ